MSAYCNTILDSIKRKVLNRGLKDLKGLHYEELLNYYKELEENRKLLTSKCIDEFPDELYKYIDASISLAFLKTCVALEETGYPQDELKRLGYCKFTDDEKKAFKELEKYLILRNVNIDNIIEYIVAERGTIFTLIKEALRKGYVNFVELMEVWKNNLDIRESLIIAFQGVYRDIFDNIKEAFVELIRRRPAWLNRVFKEYEDALLDSAEVRERFEKLYREVFQERLKEVEGRYEHLEKERVNLLETVRLLSERLGREDIDKEKLLKELEEIRSKYENIKGRYEELVNEWYRKTEEISKLAEELKKREELLSKMAEKEKETAAAKEALEAEVARLKNLRTEYEERIRILQEELTLKTAEVDSLREKLESVQKALQGRVEGNFVSYEDVESIKVIHAGKFRDKIETVKELTTPWGKLDVDKWAERVITPQAQNENVAKIGFAKLVKGGIFSKRKLVEMNLIYYLRHDKLKSLGYDYEALSLSEFLGIIKGYVEEALQDTYKFIVVGLASPTGYSGKVIDYVKSFTVSNLLIMLIDPIKNVIHYPTISPYAKEYLWLFKLEAPEEEEIEIVKVLKELYDEAVIRVGHGYVSLMEFHKKAQLYSPVSRSRALNKLIECGDVEIKKINGNPYMLFKKVPSGWCVH